MKNKNKISLEKEIIKSYLEYSISVIIGRAIPDIKDGLKPVHRRILYSMYKLKNFWKGEYKKSARIVGEVIGKYHPHGDISVYEAIVRMCQKFSLRYNLIEGQGNFGSIDGDKPAAMRYTEIKISKIGEELLCDIEKNTIDFYDNYDNTEKQPKILPSKIPNLLINGASGIAVGMVTNIPPHNISDSINACIYYLNKKKCNNKNLIKIIKSPDFPSGGIIINSKNLNKIYKKGYGKIIIRGKIHIEELNYGKNLAIIITQLPYLINKNIFLDKISNLIKKDFFFEILNIKDESSNLGIRIVIIIKIETILNSFLKKLYTNTNLEHFFNVNMVALIKKKPKLLNLKKIIKYFINHRREIIIRKSIYKIKNFKKKCNILESFIITLENLDKIIKIIKYSKNNKTLIKSIKKKFWSNKILSKFINSVKKLKNSNIIFKKIIFFKNKELFKIKKNYKFSIFQIKKLLSMKINNINKLKKNYFLEKYKKLIFKIIKLANIVCNEKKLKNIIKNSLNNIKNIYSDKKKTKIFL